jgi:hypothetical protein
MKLGPAITEPASSRKLEPRVAVSGSPAGSRKLELDLLPKRLNGAQDAIARDRAVAAALQAEEADQSSAAQPCQVRPKAQLIAPAA